MKKIGNKLVLILFFVIVSPFLNADTSPQVTARVTANPVVVNQPFTLTLQVILSENLSIEEPELPDLSQFDLLGSWTGQSTSSRLITGARGMEFKSVLSYEYNYQLVSQGSGGIKIGSFKIKIDGKIYTTKPIVVEVTQDPSQMPNIQGGAGGSPLDEMDDAEQIFNQMLQRYKPLPRAQVVPRNANEAFFIHLDIDKTEVYVGEQITVSWYLYTRGQIVGLDRLKFPDLKGFWKETIEEVPSLNFTPEVLNGVMYRKALLASHALFPIREGVAEIDEYKVRATVQLPNQVFGGFAYSEPYSYQRSSDRVEVIVKEVPREGQPKNFSGAVGFFEVQASVADKQVPINQPFALKLMFEGQGNAKLMDLPEVAWPEGIEYFDKKSEARFFKNGRSLREFEILLIPRKNGVIEIPPITFSFFDPLEKRYYEKQTIPIKVEVIGEAQALVDQDQSESQSDSPSSVDEKVELPEVSAADLKVSGETQTLFGDGLQRKLRLMSFGLLILGFCLLIFFIYIELIRVNKKQTWKEYLQARLKIIENSFKKGDVSNVAAMMTQTLSKLVGAVSQEGFSSQEFSRLLEQSPPSLQTQIGPSLIQFYQILEQVAYGPQGSQISSQREKVSLSEFKEVSYKILSYLES